MSGGHWDYKNDNADVLITIDQMIIYHDIYDVIAQYREQKLERLRHKVFMEQYG